MINFSWSFEKGVKTKNIRYEIIVLDIMQETYVNVLLGTGFLKSRNFPGNSMGKPRNKTQFHTIVSAFWLFKRIALFKSIEIIQIELKIARYMVYC